jgi:cytochrome c biogenesis protein CcmG/thiol:disulfide interchange protein DsbE
MHKFMPLGVFIALALFLGVALLRGEKEVPSPMIGRPAPLLPQAQSKPYIVNLFASWCPTCREEHKALIDLQHATGLPVYGVAVKDDPDALKKFLDKEGNPFFIITPDHDGSISLDWGAAGVPETYVVDKTGIIRFHRAGALRSRDARKIAEMSR